jgi:hypothetical protein
MPARTIPRQRKKHERENAKGRQNGYILFANETRPKIKQETPDISFLDVGRKLGKMWRALSDYERGEWNAKAARMNENRKQ